VRVRLAAVGALVCALTFMVGGAAALGVGSISLTGTVYTQNFDTLATSGTANTALPTGWFLAESGTSTRNNDAYAASSGTDNAGDTYSFGGSSERAFGELRSGTLIPVIGVAFTNNTGSAITSLDIAYTGEQWRLGTAGRADRLDFQISTDATGLTSGTWTNIDVLDFSSPSTAGSTGARDGNAAANRTNVTATVVTNVTAGATFWIRFVDFDASGADDGLSVDDFSITPLFSSGGDSAPSVASTNPANGATEVATSSNITINFSEPVATAAGWHSISCGSSGSHTALQSGGPQSYTLNPDADFVEGENCTVTVDASKVTDTDTDDPPNQMAANHVFSFTTTLPVTQISQVQGAGHLSPYAGQQVKVEGVVIAERFSNVWIQDPTPGDSDPATSEAIRIFGSSVADAVVVGNHVQVRGTVNETRPGCIPSCPPTSSAFLNLTVTELGSPGLAVTQLAATAPPAPTVIGAGGRTPPTTVIEDDAGATGNVETSNAFDYASDGIDFYETLESMLVQVNSPVATGPRNPFNEISVLADNGAGASIRTARGGIVVRAIDSSNYQLGDFNPERIILDDAIESDSTPAVNTSDRFTTPAVGVMNYDFASYKIALTSDLTAIPAGLARESTRSPVDQEIAVATFNVQNLSPDDDPAKFAELAAIIVDNLRAPDVISVEEIEDNNGLTDDSVTDASMTWNLLIAAIQDAGGPVYQYRQIDPVDDRDGGAPGGNIRVGFLFRTDRGLEFVDRPGAGPMTPNAVVVGPNGDPQLLYSPGRVDPADPAWSTPEGVRKPLAAEFKARGKKLFLIANHWKSKNGDEPLFGRFQPPARSTEAQRRAEAQVVKDFVDDILAIEPNANVIVLGDLNDFEFSETLTILEGGGTLNTLIETLPPSERYSYVFDGNSQTLDHIVVSDNPRHHFPFEYDSVHVNAEFVQQSSDHDPQVVRLDLRGRPTPKNT
jgi:endonuclease/exonuclease/phosphatase family metal-dependent hydrolase